MTEVLLGSPEAQLDDLVARAESGEEIVLVRGEAREPVARVVPPGPRRTPRPGFLKGQIHVPDSFFDPLPEHELKAWGQV